MTKYGLIALSVLLLTFITGCRKSFHTELGDKDELVVAMDIDMPGYFALEGEQYGYHYDMLQAYADRLGVKLRIITGKTDDECSRMLADGEADIVASLASGHRRRAIVMPIYTTSYVVLAGPAVQPAGHNAARRHKPSASLAGLKGRRILISSGFKASTHYEATMDSLRGTPKHISDDNAFELMASLADGEFDYLICEKSEALVGANIYPVRPVYDFEDGVPVTVALSQGVRGLREDFTAWLAEYRSGQEYRILDGLYFENGSPLTLAAYRNGGAGKCISQYDAIIRIVGAREGLDWRFLSAIAYHESRFKPHVVSHVGARGIMQIMPVVARNFNVPVEKIGETETNVMLAAKLLKSIERSIGLPQTASENDRMSIVLACYNAGVGHIADARRLAKKHGWDADSWESVSHFLEMKSQPEYYGDEVVRNGIFNSGRATSAFVNNVMSKYNSYCLLAQL